MIFESSSDSSLSKKPFIDYQLEKDSYTQSFKNSILVVPFCNSLMMTFYLLYKLSNKVYITGLQD